MIISDNIRIEEEKVTRSEVVNIKMTLLFKVSEQPNGIAIISVTNDELSQESKATVTIQWSRNQPFTISQFQLVKQFIDAVDEKLHAVAKYRLAD